jgi:hypothetical protein
MEGTDPFMIPDMLFDKLPVMPLTLFFKLAANPLKLFVKLAKKPPSGAAGAAGKGVSPPLCFRYRCVRRTMYSFYTYKKIRARF